MNILDIIVTTIQIFIIIILAPLVNGIVRKTKAQFQNRRGASIFQPYFDLIKYFKKEIIISQYSSWIYRATPYIVFSTISMVAILTPTFTVNFAFYRMSDIILLVYLFGLGRFFIALSALDTASSFGGLGSSREMTIASIVEPTMMLAIFATAASASSMNIFSMVSSNAPSIQSILNPSQILAFAGLFIVTLAETGRIPIDNPTTHLELTMIHEAMILEYSGLYLALIEWASQIKLMVFLSLLVNLFFPFSLLKDVTPFTLIIGIFIYMVKVVVLSIVVAFVESANAKLRLFRVPELLIVAFTLSILSFVIKFIIP